MNTGQSRALVRRWVALYTLGLPPEVRRDRRDEIDDDLWCQAQEAADSARPHRSLAGEILARLIFGIPADVSWRIEQRRLGRPRPQPERSRPMNARLPAVLALVGGVAWSFSLVNINQLAVVEWTGGLGPTLTLIGFLGGTVVLALATIGLVAAAQDMLSSLASTLAIIGSLISMLAVLAVPPAFLALPASSMLVVWQLSRVGALPRWVFAMHLAAPIFVLVIFAISLTGFRLIADDAPFGPLHALGLAVVLLYPFSWLAIGWSLLRTQSVTTDSVAGAA